jgi:hypothetical protein
MRGALHPTLLSWALASVCLAWSPLPVSVAAVILDEERNATLPETNGAARAVRLIPEMLQGENAQECRWNLIGFAVCVAALLTSFMK